MHPDVANDALQPKILHRRGAVMLLLPAQRSPHVANFEGTCSLLVAPITRRSCAASCQLPLIFTSFYLGSSSLGSAIHCSKANHCQICGSRSMLASCRYNYVTPTSYLELLTTFIKLLAEKRREIDVSRRRLETGLDKLLSTAAQVEVMQVRG